MLPMILGFLGSAFAPAIAGATGIAALASPLLAGSIGAGLGSFAQTGSLKEGLKTGLGSFVGGKLLGGLMGSTAGGAAANAAAANAAAAAPSVGGTVTPLLPQLQAAQASLSPLTGAGIKSALGSGMQFAQSPTGIGALVGASLAAPKPTIAMPMVAPETYDGSADKEMRPIPLQTRELPADYVPGVDREFDYGVSTPQRYEDLMAYNLTGSPPRSTVRLMAEGGKTEMEDDDTSEIEEDDERPAGGNEKTEIVEAIAAIKGQHPQPEIALGKFLAKYGEDALRDLVDSVQSGEFDDTRARFASGENGMVRGPGDGSGVDDKVPATIEGEQDVLLADGEFVLRKDATDSLEKMYGGGFLSAVNKAGDRAGEVLKKKVAA